MLYRRQDGFQHAVEIAVDVVIGETDDAPAARDEKVLARLVVAQLFRRRMRGAVDFDDKPDLAAGEIGEVGPDRRLADELTAAERAIAETPP